MASEKTKQQLAYVTRPFLRVELQSQISFSGKNKMRKVSPLRIEEETEIFGLAPWLCEQGQQVLDTVSGRMEA